MRRAINNFGWMHLTDGRLAGVSLGLDFCAELEWGIDPLREAFVVELPELRIGVTDRQIRTVPAELTFTLFEYQPADSDKQLAAALAHS